jgi:glutathione S-transferase
VPTLDCSDVGNSGTPRPLYESNIIIEYLEDAYPEQAPRLLPDDAYQRAYARIWNDFVTTRVIPSFHRFLQYRSTGGSGEADDGIEKHRSEFLGFLKEFTRAMDEEGPFFLGKQFMMPDLVLAPWAIRLWGFDQFKEGGLGIPAVGMGGEDEAIWARWRKWSDAVKGRNSVASTMSEQQYYLPIYKRYADNTAQSELEKAVRAGKGVP